MTDEGFLSEARVAFHKALLKNVLRTDRNGVPSNADRHSKLSVDLSLGILSRLGKSSKGNRIAGQMAGAKFEQVCAEFIATVFPALNHLRPGSWEVSRGTGVGRRSIADFDQYDHLAALDAALKANADLAVALGIDYLIKPDVVIVREPEDDERINGQQELVGLNVARLTSLRKVNNPRAILHASISCKWTIRSDRAQNARSEALNLMRNRKGRLPHVVVVTGEPTPNRIASIAMGTGDIDCVYHFALKELQEAVEESHYEDSAELLATMVNGKRLRDIADLPLDLVI
ncbi:MAG: hypothetical protein AMXMBFR82_09840 [Candidatus Hydrogenedentota bacterium]